MKEDEGGLDPILFSKLSTVHPESSKDTGTFMQNVHDDCPSREEDKKDPMATPNKL